jgi:methionyl-tRNA formyltransferase
MSWRIVVATRILPIAFGFMAAARELEHEVVALLTVRDLQGDFLGGQLRDVPPELDVLIPARRASLAPLLAAVQPDLVLCMGFPWKVPADALGVPTHGWLNGHPSLLPRHRGPMPWAWAIRAGDEELGITFHRMDAELDTGPILAQRSFPIGEYAEPDEMYMRSGPLMIETLKDALQRLAAGEQGTPQEPGGEYESFFGDDAVHLDLSRPAREVYRLVWAWQHTFARNTPRGPLLELDGDTVRVLRASLEEVGGATRVECADGPLWLVRTEPLEEPAPAEARP